MCMLCACGVVYVRVCVHTCVFAHWKCHSRKQIVLYYALKGTVEVDDWTFQMVLEDKVLIFNIVALIYYFESFLFLFTLTGINRLWFLLD